MQDRPDAAELLAAVAAFLETELLPTISDQRLRFRSLVAANVLAVASRELAAGDAPVLAERSRLCDLLGDTTPTKPAGSAELRQQTQALARELCRQIRAGAFDAPEDFERARQYAQAAATEKLEIANPKYLERLRRS